MKHIIDKVSIEFLISDEETEVSKLNIHLIDPFKKSVLLILEQVLEQNDISEKIIIKKIVLEGKGDSPIEILNQIKGQFVKNIREAIANHKQIYSNSTNEVFLNLSHEQEEPNFKNPNPNIVSFTINQSQLDSNIYFYLTYGFFKHEVKMENGKSQLEYLNDGIYYLLKSDIKYFFSFLLKNPAAILRIKKIFPDILAFLINLLLDKKNTLINFILLIYINETISNKSLNQLLISSKAKHPVNTLELLESSLEVHPEILKAYLSFYKIPPKTIKTDDYKIIYNKKNSNLLEISNINLCLGILFFHPFIKPLLEDLGLLIDNKFVSIRARHKAVHVLCKISGIDYNENLIFYKLICDLSASVSIPETIFLSKHNEEILVKYQNQFISEWKVLKNTSINTIQNHFLNRMGIFQIEENKISLIFENNTFDILLEQYPWNISIVKFPWLNKIIFTKFIR